MNQIKPIAAKNKSHIEYITITDDAAGQRIDNFLINHLKGVPKSKIYHIVRKGEVRVNKGRIKVSYRLEAGDVVRVPPLMLAEKAKEAPPSKTTQQLLADRIIYEDDHFIILNKPSGMSVHVGNTVRVGVVEAMRHMYPNLPQLELGHRLDSETSGCLVLAKRKRYLREFHAALREGEVRKIYWALTKGTWKKHELRVELSLQKDYRDGGKHVVEVKEDGKTALTEFATIKAYKKASLMEVNLYTGRTHQIRVHASHLNHAVAGDDRYGDTDFNKLVKEMGLKRMFLHARSIDFTLPSLDYRIKVEAPLDPELDMIITKFDQKNQRRGDV